MAKKEKKKEKLIAIGDGQFAPADIIKLAEEMNETMGLDPAIDLDQDIEDLVEAIKENAYDEDKPEDSIQPDDEFSDTSWEILAAMEIPPAVEHIGGDSDDDDEEEEKPKAKKDEKKSDKKAKDKKSSKAKDDDDEDSDDDESDDDDDEEEEKPKKGKGKKDEKKSDKKPAKKSAKDDDDDEDDDEDDEKPKGKKPAKKDEKKSDKKGGRGVPGGPNANKPKTQWGHLVGSQAGDIDELLESGETLTKMSKKLAKKAGKDEDWAKKRIESHVKHLEKDKGLTIKFSEKNDTYSIK